MKDPGLDRRLRLCVVQLDGIPRAYTSRHNLWVPAEPLVDPRDPAKLGRSLPGLSAQRLFAADKQEVYNEIRERSEAAAARHLQEILAFLYGHDLDVAVFPEYLTPISCLPELVEFSRGRAVVAGLEHVQSRAQAVYLAEIGDGQKKPEDLLQRNVSVLVADGRIHLITKKRPSAAETIRPGTGPIVEEVDLRGRKVNLGVAVCMDYLRLEEEAREQEPEILCIPAYSPRLQPFRPDAPRDYVRLFSNGAVYGGSQVMVPELPGIMTNELGVRPIQAGFEAVVLIAYDRYPQRPTGLLGTDNQLLLRAEIIERTPPNRVAMNALADLAAYAAVEDRPVVQLQKLLTSWLGQISAQGPMGEIFEVYRDILAQGTEDARIDELARSHLTVEPGNRPSAVRRGQAEYIISQLRTLTSLNKPIGEAEDEYSRLLHGLPEVASNAVTLHATAHGALSPHPLADTPGTMGTPVADLGVRDASAVSGDTDSYADVRSIVSDTFEPFKADPDFHPVKAERLRICRDIESGAQRVLNAMSGLTASASPDDLQTAAQACRFRVAAVADLLTQLTGLTPARSDFEWINATGIVAQGLAQLQEILPSDDSKARSVMTWSAGRSPLAEMATALHEATISLRRLAE